MIFQDEHFSAAQSFALARDILDRVDGSRGFAGIWWDDRRAVSLTMCRNILVNDYPLQFHQKLVHVCRQLEALPSGPSELALFDTRRLKWAGRTHYWFPDLIP